MKGLSFLALVGAAIYCAIVLSYNLLPLTQQRMSSLGSAAFLGHGPSGFSKLEFSGIVAR